MKTLTTSQIGRWDNANRYYINSEYQTESSKAIRTPSRHWPFSQYKHVLTKKYAQQLSIVLGEEVEIIK
jgi:hypothetical protein